MWKQTRRAVGDLPHRRFLSVLVAVVMLVACTDGPAAQNQVSWTPAQRDVFRAFRTSKSKDRMSLAHKVIDELPHVLDSLTLKIQAPVDTLPTESDVLNQLGRPDNSFSLDRHPEYMGGKVGADVNRGDYRVHIYEIGCYKWTASTGLATNGIRCSTLELVMFREHAVAALVAHDTPESVRHWLSVH